MSTATEIAYRMAAAERHLAPIRKRISWGLTHDLFRIMHEIKVPLIKYGRRKRRWRRALPRYEKIDIKF